MGRSRTRGRAGRLAALAGLLALPLFAACGGGGEAGAPVRSAWALPSDDGTLPEGAFFAHPFPSDLRRGPSGKARWAGFPSRSALVSAYVATADDDADGFSPLAVTTLRFDGDLDPASLPGDAAASLAEGASVRLVDVDPASPERGRSAPALVAFQAPGDAYRDPHLLSVRPVPGAPLRPGTRYAVVVTDAVRGVGGRPVAVAPELRDALEGGAGGAGDAAARARAHALVEDAALALEAVGVPRGRVVHLAVFTTADPTRELFELADALPSLVPAPALGAMARSQDGAPLEVYDGTFGPMPIFQEGTPPYTSSGGAFARDAAGQPRVVSTFDARLRIVLPDAGACPEPTSGYPVAIYAHGTGGSFRSAVRERGSVGGALAARCVATFGVDQIFHGTRPGAPDPASPTYDTALALSFFAIENPVAARANGQQAALDLEQTARLVTEAGVTLAPEVTGRAAPVRFDPARVLAYGHSQGGLNVPLWLAASRIPRGGVLSGASAVLGITLVEKSEPSPAVNRLVKVLLGLGGDADVGALDLSHPAIHLAQALVDPVDPVHYARFVTTAPRPGFPPKSVLDVEGVGPDGAGDTYAPVNGIEAGALALGLPRIVPGTRPVPDAALLGLADVAVPPEGLSGNLAGGRASGGLLQVAPAPGRNGHFVVFDVPAAGAYAAAFLGELARDPAGRLPGSPP